MSLGRIISPDDVGGNFGNVTGFVNTIYDHGIDPAAALLVLASNAIFSLRGQELTTDLPAELSPPLKSIRFRGNPDKWELSDTLDLGPAEFTLSLFFRKVNAECDADAAVASKGQTGTGEWALWIDMVGSGSDTIGFSIGGAAFDLESATGIVNDELWHHVAVTRVGTLISLYVDGLLEDTATNATDLTNSELLRFGVKNTGSDFFGGSITGGLLYFTGKDATEVANLAAGNVEPGFVSHFRFAVADILSAPAGNHGTLNGGAFFDSSTLAGQLQGKTGADEILAVSHDGVDDTVTFPAVTLVGEFTAALFFKPDDLTLQTLIGDVVTDRIQIGSSTTILVVVGAGTLTFTVPAMDTDWHTAVVARDASDNIRVFLDDVESTTGALVDAADATFAKIGAHGAAATDPFDGHTAKIVLEPREWTATERTDYFNDGSTASAFTDFRSNTGLIENAESGAPAGTVTTQYDGVDDNQSITPVTFLTGIPFSVSFRFLGRANTDILGTTTTDAITRLSSTVIRVKIASVNSDFTVPTMADDVWFKVTITRDSSDNVRCYFAGTESVTGAIVNAGTFAITTLGGASTFWDGSLEDVQVHNTDLSAAEALNYSNRITTDAGLIHNWLLATEGNLVADNIGDFADTAQDSSGNAKNGTLIGFDADPNLSWVKSVPAQLVGQQEFALSFDGVNDHVDLTTLPELENDNQPLSFSVWAKKTVTGIVGLMGKSQASGGGGGTGVQMFWDASGVLVAWFYDLASTGPNNLTCTTVLTDGVWHFCTLTFDGTTARLYVDGIEEANGLREIKASVGRIATLAKFGDATTLEYEGEMADARAYTTALSPADVATLSGGGTITPQPLGQWKLNDARVFEAMLAWVTDAYADTGRFGSSDVAEGIPFNDSDYVENVIVPSVNTTGILAASCIPPSSQRFVDGIPGTGVRLRQNGANTASFDIQSTVTFELSGIEIDGNALGGGNLVTLSGTAHNVHHNLLHDILNTTVAAGGIELKTGTTGSTIHSNFIFALTTTTGACTGILSAVVADIFANSLLDIVASTDGDGAGISVSALAVARNNVSAGSDFAYVGTFGTGTDSNVASDTTAPGTNAVQNAAAVDLFKDITLGSEDLHLKGGSPAIDVGANLMSTGIIGIHEDIDFAARPSSGVWDIGADRATLGDDFKALATQGAWGISIGFSIGLGG